MAFQVFGFELKRKEEKQLPSVVTPSNEDGAIVIDHSVSAGGLFSYGVDMEGVVKTENELVRRYREISFFPEVDFAIEDICNEAVVIDQEGATISLQLDELKLSEPIKKKFNEAFEEVLALLDFNNRGHDIFRQWYVDGRIFYHLMFRDKDIKKGIEEVRLIDPQKIKKIKKIERERTDKGVEVVKRIDEYFIYNDRGIHEGNLQGIKLTNDSVVHVTSGLLDPSTNSTIGYLQKAVKPTNQLKMIEDAVVIYRLSRAPERRIFYIDVGSMPKIKAEQYVQDMMNKFKNKLVYDAKTGELADSKKHISMMEDFWMPRRDGGKGTEITTLPGAQNLGQLEDVDYFLNKLYRSLNVPISRLKSDTGFSLGRTNEISRDEVRFSKFIDRVRSKFSQLFVDILKIQLIAKGVIKEEEWEDIKQKIKFVYAKDNHFAELKETEIIANRIQNLAQADMLVGRYISKKWVQKKILRLTDEEIDQMNKENAEDPVQQDPNQSQPQ
jgi:hypothetical protein